MKSPLPAALAVALLLTGCARHYAVTLNSGNRITSVGKPQLKNGNYVFKDGSGQSISMPASRVREIAPEGMSDARGQSGYSARPSTK
jgi:hypothetical protein